MSENQQADPHNGPQDNSSLASSRRDEANGRNTRQGTATSQNAAQAGAYRRGELTVMVLQVIFDLLIFAATSTYAVFAYHQWQEMRAQKAAMQGQLTVMTKQLESINSSSAQTERLIRANESLAEQNRELVAHSGEQAKASLAQAEAAKVSARTAQQSFYIGDRPYILVKNAELDKFEVGSVPNIAVRFENSGKTPALDVQTGLMVNVEKLPKVNFEKSLGMSRAEIIAAYTPERKNLPFPFMPEGSRSVLPAGGETVVGIRGPELTVPLMSDINASKLFLVVWGGSIYKDGLGKTHYLAFCLFYDPKDDNFVSCSIFNLVK